MTQKQRVKSLLKLKTHININLGAADSPMTGFINVDIQDLPGVDVVWDLEKFPWPFPDNCADLLIASQLVEHINPHGGIFIKFMDEAWRILKPKGQFMIATPYAGSIGYWQDPTHCFYPDTEILTKDGFKAIIDVKEKTEVLVLNPKTLKTEFSPVIRTINEDYRGDMVQFKNIEMDLMTTPNHDLFFGNNGKESDNRNWRLERADSFFKLKGHHSRRGYIYVDWNVYNQKKITIPTVKRGGNNASKHLPTVFKAEDFMAFFGWYLSEGYVDRGKTNYNISICQSKSVHQENYNEILDIIKKLGFTPQLNENQISFSSIELYHFLKPFGNSSNKYIDKQFKGLNKNLLQIMLTALIKGDGRRNGTGVEYATISKQLANDVQEIALKCGYRSTLYLEIRSPKTIIRGKIVNQSTIMYLVGISKKAAIYYPQPQKKFYEGKVVCVQVKKHHIILVRRNGRCLWVSNCNPCNELTFAYFDPLDAITGGELYKNYHPKPWHILENSWYSNGNLEVLLETRPDLPEYHKSTAEGQNILREKGLKYYG